MSANAQYVEAKRALVTFGPGDRAGVDNFLRDVPVQETPLGAYVEGMRRQREERERVMREGRRADEEARGKGRKEDGVGDGVGEMEEEDEDEEGSDE